eukprot:491862_1
MQILALFTLYSVTTYGAELTFNKAEEIDTATTCYYYDTTSNDATFQVQDTAIYPCTSFTFCDGSGAPCDGTQQELYESISNQLYTTNSEVFIDENTGNVGIRMKNLNPTITAFCLNYEPGSAGYSMVNSAAPYCIKATNGADYCGDTVVPDMCSPSVYATESFELIPGKQYYINGGDFKLSPELIIMRPNMIDSCSLPIQSTESFVTVKMDQINIEQLQVGRPIISQMKDISAMPSECPILSNVIQSVEIMPNNLARITLEQTNIDILFERADVNTSNATTYELVGTPVEIVDGSVPNDAAQRRRALSYSNSKTVDLGPNKPFTVSKIPGVKFEIQPYAKARASVELGVHHYGPWYKFWQMRGSMKVLFGADVGVRAKVTVDIPDRIKKEIALIKFKKTYTVMIGPVPVLVDPYFNLYGGVEITAGIKFECTAKFGYDGNFGFEYNKGWRTISNLKQTKELTCKPQDIKKNCEIAAKVYLRLEAGLLVYKKFADIGVRAKFGPKLAIAMPTQNCKCEDNKFETKATFDFEFYLLLRVGNFKVLGVKIPGVTLKTPKVQKSLPLLQPFCTAVPSGISDLVQKACCPPRPDATQPGTGTQPGTDPQPGSGVTPGNATQKPEIPIAPTTSIQTGNSGSSASGGYKLGLDKGGIIIENNNYISYGRSGKLKMGSSSMSSDEDSDDDDNDNKNNAYVMRKFEDERSQSKYVESHENEGYISLPWMIVIVLGIIISFMCMFVCYSTYINKSSNTQLLKRVMDQSDTEEV